ncbi:hypothetical protein NP493_457g06002 [Ridgeia piscesae]|uniref:Uncharacterized protein n=1 Tax=Ridgeia piscesae TaxID=27915 RepID=A0AAD9KZB6_RIDPI|nr:hypothetical protein NP493_457g06002 [Ridgeia piscesae]
MYRYMVVFAVALVATAGSGGVRGEDASGVDVEHPCGGSAVVERPTAVTVHSTVKAEHVSRLLTRALHRIADIKQTYVSQRIRNDFVVRMLQSAFPIAMPDLQPTFDTDSSVKTKVDATLRQLMTSLMTHIVYVDHVRRYERYWAGENPRQLPFRETTYDKEVAELQGNVIMPIACSLQQILTSRGLSLNPSAIQRLKQIEYKIPSNQYVGDMEAFVAFNSLQKLVTESRAFFSALAKAGLV